MLSNRREQPDQVRATACFCACRSSLRESPATFSKRTVTLRIPTQLATQLAIAMSLVASLLLMPTALLAQGISSVGISSVLSASDAVEAGREAFRRSARYPWYDREADGLRRVSVQPDDNLAGQRNSPWEARKSKSSRRFRSAPYGRTISIIIYVVLVAVLIALIVTIVRRAGASLAVMDNATRTNDLGFDSARVGELPFQIEGDAIDLLPMAEQLRSQGKFGQAIVYLFSYQLLHLDRNRLIRLAKGKTNRQYLRELRSNRDLQHLFERTMVAFEDVFFGEHALNRDRFETCWDTLNSFHQLSSAGVVG